MSLRKYLLLIGVNVLFAWLVLVLIILNINPNQAHFLVIILLYASILVASGGSFFLLNFISRIKVKKDFVALKELKIALRQGVLFGIMVIVSLFLSRMGLLHTWNWIILIGGFIMLEFMVLRNPRG